MWDEFLRQLAQFAGEGVPNLIMALLILIAGWLVALLLSALVRGVLRRTKLDQRLNKWVAEEGKAVDVAGWVGKGIFYLIMLFVLIAFFQVLGLTLITQPLNQLLGEVFQYAPRLVGAGILLLVAWIVAGVFKFLLSRALRLAKVDEWLGGKLGLEEDRQVPLTKTVADAVYWFVFLLFLPAVLNALALEGLLTPVQGLVDELLGFLPNIFAAALILALGWFAARVVQRVASNLLAATGADQLSERVGLTKVLGKQKLSAVLGLVLYVLILIPVLIAALNALALEAITRPAADMLGAILAALPSIFAAALVLVVSYVVGRVVSGLIANLLASIGFNTVLARLGLGKEPAEGQRTPAEIVGYLVLVAIMVFAIIEALQLLGFGAVADLVVQFTVFAGQVILGLVIFAFGLYLANLAAKTVQDSGVAQSGLLALVARGAILALAAAMALRQMGLANEIINLAFGLLLGGIALAAALAFGLGGREVAGRELKEWVDSAKSEK